jgi:anti-sigma regulatory factor (Ser/Thr protein kinase)
VSDDGASAAARDVPPPSVSQGLLHEAYLYADTDRYLTDLLTFVRGGLARNQPVLIAVPGPRLEHLRAGLSLHDAARVQMRDMTVAGGNPGRILGSVLTPFVAEHPGRRVRIISEAIWPDRTDEEYPACAEHEALVNLALARTGAHIVCPYDATHLSPHVLTDAARTHPILARAGERGPSPSYEDPGTAAAAFDPPLTAPPEDSEIVVINTVTGPRTARRVAYEFATRIGLSPQRRTDLMITVHELAVNSILHAGGTGLLSVWTTGEHVVVQVDDGGQINDPLVGRRLPGASERGHGLHVVHHVADLVRVHRNGDGTSIRAYFKQT